jgi:hypothetical protein
MSGGIAGHCRTKFGGTDAALGGLSGKDLPVRRLFILLVLLPLPFWLVTACSDDDPLQPAANSPAAATQPAATGATSEVLASTAPASTGSASGDSATGATGTGAATGASPDGSTARHAAPPASDAAMKGTVSVDFTGSPEERETLEAAYEVPAGSTAWDAIKAAVGEENLSYDDFGGSLGIFITGFNGVVVEGNHFWEFKLNGETSEVGVSSYEVQQGDVLEFVYSSF